MNWLRWYHGTVSDPKWRVIAKKTGQPVASVIAVWAALMENASESEERGTLHNWSNEVVGTMLDLDDETVKRICNAMQQNETKVLVSDRLASWEKRNPKREREDNSSERVQRFRERKRQVTPSNAKKRPEQIRKEQNKEEKPLPAYTPDFETFWKAYPSKVGKGDAFTSWKKNGHPSVEKIVIILDLAKQSRKWREGIIPNPATWLNQKRWDDDYGPSRSSDIIV